MTIWTQTARAIQRSRELSAQVSEAIAASDEIKRRFVKGELPSALRRNLQECLPRLGAVSAAVMIATDRTPRGEIRVFSARGFERLDRLEFFLGEGPGTDICRGRSALEPDLAKAFARWPAYTPAALEAGARATFGFPLGGAHTRLGALVLDMAKPGLLDAQRFEGAAALAKRCAERILKMQSQARPGELALALESALEPTMRLHQATGVLSYALGIPPADALALMRAAAWSNSIPVDELVEGVLTGSAEVGPS